MSCEVTKRGARRAFAAAGLVAVVSGYIPMDDAMQAIFGRSMRSQISFDPYENTLLPPEGAVSFANGKLWASCVVGAGLRSEIGARASPSCRRSSGAPRGLQVHVISGL